MKGEEDVASGMPGIFSSLTDTTPGDEITSSSIETKEVVEAADVETAGEAAEIAGESGADAETEREVAAETALGDEPPIGGRGLASRDWTFVLACVLIALGVVLVLWALLANG